MNLNVFKETIKQKNIRVEDHKVYVDVYYSDKLCAKIFMDKDYAYWMDTSVVPQPFRRELSSYVTSFASVPFFKRRDNIIARHSNHMYIKSVDMKTQYNSFTAKVEMTGNANEADKCITDDKRKVLEKLFGKEIHYVEVIE